MHAGKYWGLPKGHIEHGESAEQAALREISEECGVPLDSLTIVGRLPSAEYVYRRGGTLTSKLVEHFLVTVPPGTAVTPQAGEIDEVQWMTIDEASARASFADTRTALTAARTALAALPR